MLSGRPVSRSPWRKSLLKYLRRKQGVLDPGTGTQGPKPHRMKSAMKFRRHAFPEVCQRQAQDRS